MKKPNSLYLKVYKNKCNNQRSLILPKIIPRDKKKVKILW